MSKIHEDPDRPPVNRVAAVLSLSLVGLLVRATTARLDDPVWFGATVTGPAILVGCWLIYWGHRSSDFRSNRAVVFGAMLLMVSGLFAVLGWMLAEAAMPSPPHSSIENIRLFADSGEEVYFEIAADRYGGPDVFKLNKLARMEREACQIIQELIKDEKCRREAAFQGDWRSALIRWQRAPDQSLKPRALDTELHLIDAERHQKIPVPSDKKLADVLASRVTQSDWTPGIPGMPEDFRRLPEGQPREKTRDILLHTGDVTHRSQAENARPGDDKLPPLISIVMPSVSRSDGDWRKVAGKIALFETESIRPILLSKEQNRVRDQLPVALLFSFNFDGASGQATYECDSARRAAAGPDAGNWTPEERQDLKNLIAKQLGMMSSGSTQTGAQAPAFGGGWLLCALLFWMIIAPRFIATTVEAQAIPSRKARAFALALSVGGTAAMVWITSLVWPGGGWQVAGIPGMAVWAFAATFWALVTYPVLYNILSGRDQRLRGTLKAMAIGLPVVCSGPLMGLGVPAGDDIWKTLPYGIIIGSQLIMIGFRGTTQATENDVHTDRDPYCDNEDDRATATAAERPRDKWAKPWPWACSGAGIALLSAWMLIGAIPVAAPGWLIGGSYHLTLGACAVVIFALLWWLAIPRWTSA